MSSSQQCRPTLVGTAATSKRKSAVPIAVMTAYSRLQKHPQFHGHLGTIDLGNRGSTLVIAGAVPSFYLKQVLQTILRDIPGVERIDNQVRVVSSTGLSSEPTTASPTTRSEPLGAGHGPTPHLFSQGARR